MLFLFCSVCTEVQGQVFKSVLTAESEEGSAQAQEKQQLKDLHPEFVLHEFMIPWDAHFCVRQHSVDVESIKMFAAANIKHIK